jgi:ribose transport system substrate-binding protein
MTLLGRTLAICAVLGLGLLMIAGCGGEKKATQAPHKTRIALIMKSLANEFFKTMEDGAKKYQEQHAAEFDLICQGIKDELDVNAQMQYVEQMIAQKVDAIVIAPADSKALVAACKKAVDAGIVVVNIDNKLDAAVLADKGVKIPFVGPDNRKGAKLVGDYLAKKLQAGDPVIIIEGVPSAFNAQQRKAGFEDAMNAAGMKIISSQSAGWEMAKAKDVVSAAVTEHPEVKAFLCANDSMALGAVAALKSDDKAGKIAVVGFDNISAVHALIKEGKVLATADQHADQLAVFGIQYAIEMINKKATPADRETPVDLMTAENPR